MFYSTIATALFLGSPYVLATSSNTTEPNASNSTAVDCWDLAEETMPFVSFHRIRIQQTFRIEYIGTGAFCNGPEDLDLYMGIEDADEAIACIRTAEAQEKKCSNAGACCAFVKRRRVGESPVPTPPSIIASENGIAPFLNPPPSLESIKTNGSAFPIKGIQNKTSCNTVADFGASRFVQPIGFAAIGPVGYLPKECNSCVSVTGPNGLHVILKVESTFNGSSNDLQISESHYEYIATVKGKLQYPAPIEWITVECPPV